MKPRGDQVEQVARLVAEPTCAALLNLDTGNGKAQPLDSLVLTPSGFVRMGDIQVGHLVVTPENRNAQVLGVYPQGVRPVYRVSFADGRSVLCDIGHLWTIHSSPRRGKTNARRVEVITTREMLRRRYDIAQTKADARMFVQRVAPMDFGNEWDSFIDPYNVGLLLGDGGLSGASVRFSTDDPELLMSLQKDFPSGVTLKYAGGYDYRISSSRGSKNPYLEELRRLGIHGSLSRYKRIPERLLNAPYDVRFALLQGLFDTDGHGTANGSVEFSTASQELAEQVVWLVRSLGGKAATKTKQVCLPGWSKARTYYAFVCSLPEYLEPFRLSRRKARHAAHTKYTGEFLSVRSIEYVGEQETQCILIDDPKHEYVTDGFVRTHNTTISLFAAKDREAQTVLVVAPLNTKDGWARHAKAIVPHLPFKVIDSAHLDVFTQLAKQEPGVYYVTKDYFALSGTSLPMKVKPDGSVTKGRMQVLNWRKVSPDFMIFDESHLGTNRKTAVFKVLVQPRAGFKLAMSATPAGNRFDGLWETTRWLWPDVIDRSKQRWVATWCATEYNPHNYSHVKVVGERSPGAFVASLPCYVTGKSVGKVPVKVVEVKTPLSLKQREQYDKMLKDAFIWIEENPLVAELPMVKKIRLRQIALGEVTFDENDEVGFADDCHSVKADACELIIKRHPGEPILFLTDSKRYAKMLAKRLGGEAWTGDLSPAKRPALKAAFGVTVQHIVAVIGAFGTGTDGVQERCSVEVWLNRSFNGTDNVQGEGRLNRQGQKAPFVTRYNLTAPSSGDTIDFERLVKQRKVLDASL